MAQFSESVDVPDMGRRQFMNLLTFGTVTGVALGALYPVVNYFIPPATGGAGGGTTAKGRPNLYCGGKQRSDYRLRHQRRLHPPGLRRSLERGRKQIQMPLPRFSIRLNW